MHNKTDRQVQQDRYPPRPPMSTLGTHHIRLVCLPPWSASSKNNPHAPIMSALCMPQAAPFRPQEFQGVPRGQPEARRGEIAHTRIDQNFDFGYIVYRLSQPHVLHQHNLWLCLQYLKSSLEIINLCQEKLNVCM